MVISSHISLNIEMLHVLKFDLNCYVSMQMRVIVNLYRIYYSKYRTVEYCKRQNLLIGLIRNKRVEGDSMLLF